MADNGSEGPGECGGKGAMAPGSRHNEPPRKSAGEEGSDGGRDDEDTIAMADGGTGYVHTRKCPYRSTQEAHGYAVPQGVGCGHGLNPEGLTFELSGLPQIDAEGRE